MASANNEPEDPAYKTLVDSITNKEPYCMQAIIGISFSRLNMERGAKSYAPDHVNLHKLVNGETPYLRALRIIGGVMDRLDPDRTYDVYRFGCANTKDMTVLPLLDYDKKSRAIGRAEIERLYKDALGRVDRRIIEMSGPLSFAPIIKQGITICKADPDDFYLLFILTDGESINPKLDNLAVNQAASYPLCIIVICIGDGPFKLLKDIAGSATNLPDNFKLVYFTEIERKCRTELNQKVDSGKLKPEDVETQLRKELAVHIFDDISRRYERIQSARNGR